MYFFSSIDLPWSWGPVMGTLGKKIKLPQFFGRINKSVVKVLGDRNHVHLESLGKAVWGWGCLNQALKNKDLDQCCPIEMQCEPHSNLKLSSTALKKEQVK